MVRNVGRLTKGVVYDLPVAVVGAVFGRAFRRRRVIKLEQELAAERNKLREHQVRVATLEAELAALREKAKAQRGAPTVVVAEREEVARAAAATTEAAVAAEARAEAEAGMQVVVEVAEVEVLEEIETETAPRFVGAYAMGPGEQAKAAAPVDEDVYPVEIEDEEAEVFVTAADWDVAVVEVGVVVPVVEPGRRDDLTRMQGIGAKSAEKLYAAGIMTFGQLAALDEARLAAIIQAPDWRRPDYGQWISQAAEAATAPPVPADDLAQLEGIGRTYAERLQAAGIASFARLAEADAGQLAAIIQAPEWRQPDFESWISQARLVVAQDEAGLAALQARLSRREGDNLALVQGLGAIYAVALRKAGIASFADLAATTPDQLEAIVSAAGLRHADFQAWIDEAAQRAAGKRVKREKRQRPTAARPTPCPQDLGRVKGIDVVYEQRLYEAGIGTFWELANTPEQILAEVLKVEEFQGVDLADLKLQAAELAVETGSEGRVWEGKAPDDFERIEGIGDVYERRLYDAGICTYGALAGATVAQLAEICQAPEFAVPDYASWIAQARGLMGVA